METQQDAAHISNKVGTIWPRAINILKCQGHSGSICLLVPPRLPPLASSSSSSHPQLCSKAPLFFHSPDGIQARGSAQLAERQLSDCQLSCCSGSSHPCTKEKRVHLFNLLSFNVWWPFELYFRGWRSYFESLLVFFHILALRPPSVITVVLALEGSERTFIQT